MDFLNAQHLLERLCKRWKRRYALRIGIQTLVIVLLVTALINLFFSISNFELVLLFSIFIFLAYAANFFLKGLHKISLIVFARHLNRKLPELEESCELILKSDSQLSRLERLQLKRTLNTLFKLNFESTLPQIFPERKWLLAFGFVFMAFVGSMLVPDNWLNSTAISKTQSSAPIDLLSQTSTSQVFPQVKSMSVQIEPPAYTRNLRRTVHSYNIKAEEGARLSWEIQFEEKVKAVALVFSNSDTLNLMAEQEHYEGARIFKDSGFYHLVVTDANNRKWNSEYHLLEVIPDKPPTIIIIEPEQKTEIEPNGPESLKLKAIVDDDYGLTDTHIIATVSKGSGESIKFRELELDFDSKLPKSKRSSEFISMLSFDALQMNFGDELYFFIEASDNRRPEPNRIRSETIFVILKDTSSAVLTSSFGLAVNPLPEYFRSQRQIIIDTEKLLQEKAQLSKQEFEGRSNNLGIDQKALRLRYGQFLGEESESGLIIEAATGQEDEHLGLQEAHEEEFADENFEAFGAEESEEQSIIPDDLRHEHDYEENATLFSQSIKDQLKAALAEMWEAELHLRTFKPKKALPYEYRALVLLKRVQQDSRIYVKRVGFDPPPLKPEEKRLTGDLTAIENRFESESNKEKKPFPYIRKALHLLQQLRSEQTTIADTDVLEMAGQQIARKALQQPAVNLHVLNNLKKIIQQMQSNEEMCLQCIQSVEAALWEFLPTVEPKPYRSHRSDSKLSESYFEKLKVAY